MVHDAAVNKRLSALPFNTMETGSGSVHPGDDTQEVCAAPPADGMVWIALTITGCWPPAPLQIPVWSSAWVPPFSMPGFFQGTPVHVWSMFWALLP
jgi:hypothetical protein